MARGSVRKRGSTWTVALDVGADPVRGNRRQKSKGGFRTRKAAEAALRELSTSVDAGRFVERSTKTVGEYLDEWIEVVRPRLRPTTWNSYRQSVAHIKGRIGAVPLQSLAPLEVENLYKQLLATRGRNGRLLNPKTGRGVRAPGDDRHAPGRGAGLAMGRRQPRGGPSLDRPDDHHGQGQDGHVAA